MNIKIRNSNSNTSRHGMRRRGMSLLIVILLISVTTVLSYAVLRGQSTAVHIQANADLRATARHAAISGLTYGIQTMHTDSWGGVEFSETRQLESHESFTVSFAAGDPSLTPGDADYDDYAYRVTVYSTGHAKDPQDTARTASYTVRAVMRLIPRALSTWTDFQPEDPNSHPSWPADWYKMDGFTVYQTHEEDVHLELPCHLEGKVRFQKQLYIAEDYPSPFTQPPWQQYLLGLRKMQLENGLDYRPVNGPVCFYESMQPIPYYFYLRARLYFDRQNVAPDVVSSDWQKPQNMNTYQIYPGGPVYEVEELLGTNQENITLGPNPLTNPLGLFYRNGNCDLRSSVSIRGTLFCNGDIIIRGAVQSNSVDMPALVGGEGPVRLPVMTANDLEVEAGSSTTINGLVALFDKFDIKESPSTLPFHLTGRLITKRLEINKRTDWAVADWDGLYGEYRSSSSDPFPEWLASRGLDPDPKIKILPDESPYLYHWNHWDNPIYAPHDDDNGGLRWEMLEWKEGDAAN